MVEDEGGGEPQSGGFLWIKKIVTAKCPQLSSPNALISQNKPN